MVTTLMYILINSVQGFLFSTSSPILQLQTIAILTDGRRLNIFNFVYISLIISNLNADVPVDHIMILWFFWEICAQVFGLSFKLGGFFLQS